VVRIKAHNRGWTATRLGYSEPREPEWAEGYQERIAIEEIEKRKKAEERRAFTVKARNDKQMSAKVRLKFWFLKLWHRARVIPTKGANKEYICATNGLRESTRIHLPMLVMEEHTGKKSELQHQRDFDPQGRGRLDNLAGGAAHQRSPAPETVVEGQSHAALETVVEGQSHAAPETVVEGQSNAAPETVVEGQSKPPPGTGVDGESKKVHS
jgi:hypothetical protein